MGRVKRKTWLACALAVSACQAGGRDVRPAKALPDAAEPRVSTRQTDTTVSQWQIIPGRSGTITSESREADLRHRYGPDAVDSTRIELGEGETAPGTVLYPRDSLRRAEILWQDTVARRRPTRIILRGNQSKWQVGPGISLGTSLKELERLNGRPFTLAGFGWDYAGVITDWKSGALDSALAGIKLYLDPAPAQYESAPYAQVLGDRDYSSALPPMQQLNPKVTQIFVDFE
jgi:hypothetical protein